MVQFMSFVCAAILFAGAAVARPADSAINEPAVAAPDGTPITEVVSSTAAASASAGKKADTYGSSGSYGSSYGSSGSYGAAPPTYGSGSSKWGNSGYNDCVNQCVAQYGSPAYQYTPSSTSQEEGSSGNSATHTVIVAPSQGVLRYIPFALNASVGDTVKFMWGANNHTVTKGSELTPCNRSGDSAFFASGSRNKDFVFTQVINDTNPLFFYCATPGHCSKGMFGVINPPSALNNPTSVSGMMQSFVANNSNIAAMAADSDKRCAGTKAATWGGNINMAAVPDWARPMMIENTLYTRNFLAANPELMKDDGTVDMSAAGTNPMMIPQDLSVALSGNNGAPPVSSASSTSQVASSTPSAAGAINPNGNGAGSLVTPRVLVGAMVVLATVFLF